MRRILRGRVVATGVAKVVLLFRALRHDRGELSWELYWDIRTALQQKEGRKRGVLEVMRWIWMSSKQLRKEGEHKRTSRGIDRRVSAKWKY